MLKGLIKGALWRGYRLGREAGPPILTHPHLVRGLDVAQVSARARLTVEDDAPGARILLGPGAFVAEGVQLTAASGGRIVLGADTSLQADCLLGGDVRVGAHCLFGRYVFVSSTTHRFRDHPAWLIRDQDRAIHRDPVSGASPRSRAVVIEDDCWIGQGVVINPGVTIGRGAVLGAGSVVTKDLPPYAIAAGMPAKIIGQRLDFAPPPALDVRDDSHLPYFYRGFRLTQAALTESRAQGLVIADGNACLVLAPGGRLRLCGRSDTMQTLVLNGAAHPVDGAFDLSINAASPRGGVLADHMVVEIAAEKPWALASAESSP